MKTAHFVFLAALCALASAAQAQPGPIMREEEKDSGTLWPGQTIVSHGVKVTWRVEEFKDGDASGSKHFISFRGPKASIGDMLLYTETKGQPVERRGFDGAPTLAPPRQSQSTTRPAAPQPAPAPEAWNYWTQRSIGRAYLDGVVFSMMPRSQGPSTWLDWQAWPVPVVWTLDAKPTELPEGTLFASAATPVVLNALTLSVSEHRVKYPGGGEHFELTFSDSASGEKAAIPAVTNTHRRSGRFDVYVRDFDVFTRTASLSIVVQPDKTIRGAEGYLEQREVGMLLGADRMGNGWGAKPAAEILGQLSKDRSFETEWLESPGHPESVAFAKEIQLEGVLQRVQSNGCLVRELLHDYLKPVPNDESHQLTFEWKDSTHLRVSAKNYDLLVKERENAVRRDKERASMEEIAKRDFALRTQVYPIAAGSVSSFRDLVEGELSDFYVAKKEQVQSRGGAAIRQDGVFYVIASVPKSRRQVVLPSSGDDFQRKADELESQANKLDAQAEDKESEALRIEGQEGQEDARKNLREEASNTRKQAAQARGKANEMRGLAREAKPGARGGQSQEGKQKRDVAGNFGEPFCSESVFADEKANALIVTATPETHKKIAGIVGEMEGLLVPAKAQGPASACRIEAVLLQGGAGGAADIGKEKRPTLWVAATAPGAVKWLALPGTKVKKGDKIANIDESGYRAQLAEAEAGLEEEKGRLAIAEEKLKTAELKVKSEVEPPGAENQAKAERISSTKDVREAEARVAYVKSMIEQCQIQAPVSGVISEINASIGGMASGGGRLISIVPDQPANTGEGAPKSPETSAPLQKYGLTAEDVKTFGLDSVSEMGRAVVSLLAESSPQGKAHVALTGDYALELEYQDYRPPYVIVRGRLLGPESGKVLLENSLYLEKGKPSLLGVTNLRQALILVVRLSDTPQASTAPAI